MGGKISPVAIHSLIDISLSAVTGIAQSNVNPQSAFLAGVGEVADQFDLFKMAELEYRIHPMDPTDTTNQVVCFYPDIDIQTQTNTQAAQSPIAAVQTRFCGVPSPWIRVPRSQLKGMLDWYKCTPDAGAAEFENQGTIQFVGGLGDTLKAEFRGVILFKNPVSSALMMDRAVNRAVEQGKVMRIPTPLHKTQGK